MFAERVGHKRDEPIHHDRWVVIVILLLVFSCGAYFTYQIICIDGCGPYQNRSSVADLDSDGDLDVILWNRRHESEYTVWQGATLWTNLGGGQFTSKGLALPEVEPVAYFAGVAGDVDGDGSADITLLAFNDLRFYLNHGGVPGWDPGIFRLRGSASPGGETGTSDWIVFGDLNNDGDIDAFIPGCCRMAYEGNQKEKMIYVPSYSWVWINEKNNAGQLVGHSRILKELGDLPVSAAALGDLDGGGFLDVFAAIQSSNAGASFDIADRVLLNDGTGNFRDSGQRLADPDQRAPNESGPIAFLRDFQFPWAAQAGRIAGSTAVALGDLDNDGDLDALVGKATGAVIWINQGGPQGGQEGIFASSDQWIPGSRTEAVFLTDLDKDGDLDAIVADKNQASIWWNDGKAGFQDSGQRLRYNEKHGLAVGDFNGDGYPDVFSAAYNIEFHLWLNQGNGVLGR